MRRQRSRPKRLLRDLVAQRAETIIAQAEEAARRGDFERARELGRYAIELSMRTGVRLPRSLKRRVCKNCRAPLVPGVTCTIRARSQDRCFSYLVVRCSVCGYIHRRPFKKTSRGALEPEEEDGGEHTRLERRADRQARPDRESAGRTQV